jgi:P-type conjugative transfer protein TrbG
MQSRALLLAVIVTIGCAGRQQPTPQYVRAVPLADAPRAPAVIEVPKPLPLPGQLQRFPAHEGRRADGRQPADVISDANRKATEGPDRDRYFNAIVTYDYDEGALYQVYTAPLRLTTIELQPGERIVGKVAAGDTIRWVTGVGKSGAGTAEQQHLFIKPTRAGLSTTMAVTTDRRTYYLVLHSFDEAYMVAIRWRYPQDEVADVERSAARDEALAQNTIATSVNLDALNFAYKVNVEKGHPSWMPTRVFDDGRKTFVRFPPSMLNREAPVLFVLSAAGEIQIVNYRVRDDYYVVDRLFERAELRLGQKDQEIVRIARDR